MKILLKILIPVLVLIGSAFAAKTILENRPEPRKRPQFPKMQAVEATTLSKSNYPVVIKSQGTVQPTKSTTLVAEVTGTVTELSDMFVVGGNFKKGDVLLQLDERDYAIALTQAEANLAQSTAALQEETARGRLAKSEWDSMRAGQKASSFTLRLPQQAAARANRDAARAQVERATLDLERTRFVAPFDGRVLESSVNQGQFVTRGSRLGQIYATSSVDVRLPLSNRQLTFLDLPGTGQVPKNLLPNIELKATIAGVEQTWTGKVVRAEGVDAGTQQLNVIARVEDPFAPGKPPLRIGQYVEADVAGRVLEDVFVVPRSAVREDREVLLVDKDGKLQRQEIIVAWSDSETIAVSDGLAEGSVLVTTPLSTVTSGTPVRATIDGKAPPPPEGRRGGKRGGKGGDGQGNGEFNKGGANKDVQAKPDGKPENGQRAADGKRREGKPGAGKRGDGQRGQANRRGGNNNGESENPDRQANANRENTNADSDTSNDDENQEQDTAAGARKINRANNAN